MVHTVSLDAVLRLINIMSCSVTPLESGALWAEVNGGLAGDNELLHAALATRCETWKRSLFLHVEILVTFGQVADIDSYAGTSVQVWVLLGDDVQSCVRAF